MRARTIAWFRQRSRREQRLLVVMAALAAVVFAWLLVVRPVDDALAEARREHAEAVIAAARVARAAEAVRGIERRVPARTSQDVPQRVAALAAAAGIVPARSTPEAGGVGVSLDAVRAAALFGWLDRVERDGLVVERFAARANPDRTLAVDLVIRRRR